jgi:hypothetical protein
VDALDIEIKNGHSHQEYDLDFKFSGEEAVSSVQPHLALRILPKTKISLLSYARKYD